MSASDDDRARMARLVTELAARVAHADLDGGMIVLQHQGTVSCAIHAGHGDDTTVEGAFSRNFVNTLHAARTVVRDALRDAGVDPDEEGARIVRHGGMEVVRLPDDDDEPLS